MGYNEVLKTLLEQLNQCKNEDEYLKIQEKIALSTCDLALLIGVSMQSISRSIRKLIDEERIKVIVSNDNTIGSHNKKKYCLNKQFVKEVKEWK